MANKVFANKREITCKAASGKAIAAFPDVCFTPPLAPPTPPGVPIPYPNTALASDTDKGSKNVKISNKPVYLKGKSCIKTSSGDDAGNTPKKGVVTGQTKGKAYFQAGSMDVKIEGKNVTRHMDLLTSNHASQPGNTPPWVYLDSMDMSPPEDHKCKEEITKAKTECASSKVVNGKRIDCTDECKKAMGCILVPKKKDKVMCCAPDNTGDHLIEDHWIWDEKHSKLMPDFQNLAKDSSLTAVTQAYQNAPTMCVNRSRYSDKHGIGHGTRGVMEDTFIKPGRQFTLAAGRAMAVMAQKHAYPDSNCNKACTESQIDAFYGPPFNPDGSNRILKKPDSRQALKPEQRQAALARVFPNRK